MNSIEIKGNTVADSTVSKSGGVKFRIASSNSKEETVFIDVNVPKKILDGKKVKILKGTALNVKGFLSQFKTDDGKIITYIVGMSVEKVEKAAKPETEKEEALPF